MNITLNHSKVFSKPGIMVIYATKLFKRTTFKFAFTFTKHYKLFNDVIVTLNDLKINKYS